MDSSHRRAENLLVAALAAGFAFGVAFGVTLALAVVFEAFLVTVTVAAWLFPFLPRFGVGSSISSSALRFVAGSFAVSLAVVIFFGTTAAVVAAFLGGMVGGESKLRKAGR